jgi:hypothetical protein
MDSYSSREQGDWSTMGFLEGKFSSNAAFQAEEYRERGKVYLWLVLKGKRPDV